LAGAGAGLVLNMKTLFQVTDTLAIVDGDMLRSDMQTLTVPVNTVGVMGKGLALQVKLRYPDVHAEYQRACRQGLLAMGKPYLYKPKADRWFLLFPTKRHWREGADLAGIEEGLRWLLANYKALGITSLAVPALGAGLGRLPWRSVGPLMCRYLAKLDIPVALYLPWERNIPRELLAPELLLCEA
jgi:O-acetyl-ADP-ribose deacetylase (regulator of RNase III)